MDFWKSALIHGNNNNSVWWSIVYNESSHLLSHWTISITFWCRWHVSLLEVQKLSEKASSLGNQWKSCFWKPSFPTASWVFYPALNVMMTHFLHCLLCAQGGHQSPHWYSVFCRPLKFSSSSLRAHLNCMDSRQLFSSWNNLWGTRQATSVTKIILPTDQSLEVNQLQSQSFYFEDLILP